MIANDGEVVWIHEVVSMVANSDQRTVLRGVMVDITSLKKAEQEIASTALRLAESERRLAAILDTAAVGIVTVDECRRIISFNIEAERVFGYRAHEMLGQELDRLVPDLFAAPNQDRDWRPVAGSAAGGRIVPLTATVSTVTMAGRTTVTALMRDMTEAQKAEETMRALLEERELDVIRGEAANRAKANFLAVMSHELRTPLNAIIGFSDVISREIMGPIGNEAYRGYADDIHHSGNLLLTIVNNILDLSRVDARKDELDIVELGMVEAWRPIASTLLANAAAKDIALTVLTLKRDRTFAADRNAISHILLNLVSNAIKFTAAGGSIEVGQEERDGGSGDVALYVRDTGRGIPPDKLNDVMKPFVQVSDSYVRDAGGIGLGLAICKSLAEAMSGRIAIESELGKGTVVRVFLPACVRSSARSAAQRPASVRHKKNGHAAPAKTRKANGRPAAE
jgi:PAS domain S-box-containing protein